MFRFISSSPYNGISHHFADNSENLNLLVPFYFICGFFFLIIASYFLGFGYISKKRTKYSYKDIWKKVEVKVRQYPKYALIIKLVVPIISIGFLIFLGLTVHPEISSDLRLLVLIVMLFATIDFVYTEYVNRKIFTGYRALSFLKTAGIIILSLLTLFICFDLLKVQYIYVIYYMRFSGVSRRIYFPLTDTVDLQIGAIFFAISWILILAAVFLAAVMIWIAIFPPEIIETRFSKRLLIVPMLLMVSTTILFPYYFKLLEYLKILDPTNQESFNYINSGFALMVSNTILILSIILPLVLILGFIFKRISISRTKINADLN